MTLAVTAPSSGIAPPDTAAKPGRRHRVGDETVVVSATGVVSLLNYGYTLILLWLLPARQFAEAGSISALLLICGTISGAALPWVLAQEVLRSGQDRVRRRMAVTFCVFATLLQGAAAGLATCLIVMHYAGGPVLASAFGAVVFIFMGATASGYFQGLQQFRLIAALKVSEVIVKIATGVALIALGAGATGAIAGFALGAAVVAGVGLAAMSRDITWSRSALAGRHLWASTQGLMAIQAGVAVLASMDVVIGSLVLGASPALATYQAANILGRVPVFIGAALSIIVFPRMIAGRRSANAVIRQSLRLYVAVCIPVAVVTATLPGPIEGVLFPARYGDVGAILPWSALAGLAMGVVNLTTTYFQATGAFRRTTSLLAMGVALCAALDVFGLRLHGVVGLAIAVAVGAGVVGVVLLRRIARTWPGSLEGLARPLVGVTLGCLPLVLVRQHLVAWCLWALGVGLVFALRSLLSLSSPEPPDGGPTARPRVLHLGYEDPRRPGAGGGSVRTHEINKRLAAEFDITVVCARYPGATPRVEDGVHYIHSGLAVGDFPARLAYFASLPLALSRYRSDLVVEDFGAPFSSVGVPWMTDRPTLGVVQWLFAREKSHQYHLPFHWVERIGVRSHHSMIAVSDDLGADLSTRNPTAQVTVVANGLDAGAFAPQDRTRAGIAYLGRLEIAQKGLDLLLEAYALIAESISQDLVLGGDGPDRAALVELADRLGIAERVRFAGRVPAEERFAWLAASDVLAMPSRYETFGMVAAEALAVRTPVVAFDIPCLRALVDDEVGTRVPAFDVPAFADALRVLATDVELRARRGAAGPDRVAGLNWDELAGQQGQVYHRILDGEGATSDAPEVAAGSAAADQSNVGRSDAAPSDAAQPVAAPSDTDRSGSHHAAPDRSTVSLFDAQCQASPEQVAVVETTTRWTYRELHRAAAAVATALAGHGITRGDAVGVCLPRSKEAIAAMWGIWSLGAIYVPLDPEYPTARLAAMGETVAMAAFVGQSERHAAVAPSAPLVTSDEIVPGGPAKAMPRRQRPTKGHGFGPEPDDVAYILFTSGSSGRPKAVQVSHRSLRSVVDWVRSAIDHDDLARTVTSVSFSFDPFILEVIGPLTVGGSVRVIPTALAIGDVDTGATLLANTPSVLAELARARRLPPTLRTVIVGGETLSPALATELLTSTSIRRLINTYGPTEATVLATACDVALPLDGPVPIGRSLPGAQVVLLDADGEEVPAGDVGEICIHGPQVAEGYRGDPEATAERFVQWHAADGSSIRVYRTGDLGRRLPDGAFEFCGRRDRQLKLRGFRIEPGEIEATLALHPGVSQAVVTADGVGAGARLIAHVASIEPDLGPAEIRRWLSDHLPRHLVPDGVVVMESFPTTEHGKVAVDDLPAWQPALPVRDGVGSGVRGGGTGPDQAGGTGEFDRRVDTVSRLAGRVLGYAGPISATDDVLDDLGASSLALFQLLTAMEEEFDSRLEIGRILEDTTIAGLARLVGSVSDAPVYLAVNDGGTKPPIYLIHAYLGTALHYRRLGPYLSDRPLVGIQVQEFGSAVRPIRTSIAQMAEEAVAQIRSRQPVGPYVLGGHSAGGLVAYEAARLLAGSGEDVPLVVLIDSPVPRSSIHYLWAEAVLNWPDIRTASAVERCQQAWGAVERRLDRFRRGPGNDRVRAAITRSYRAINLAVRDYQPGPYAGDVAVLWTRQGAAMALGRKDLGWGAVASGRLVSSEVPGLHNTLLEGAQLQSLGRQLNGLVDEVDERARAATAARAAPDRPVMRRRTA